MPVIDPDSAPLRTGTIYPAPMAALVAGRSSRKLGEAAGLTQYGVNMIILQPGAAASARHWHEREDEFLIVTQGEMLLVDEDGEHPMRSGDCAAFPAGQANGHHMVNHSDSEARFLVVGTSIDGEVAHYPDHGLKVVLGQGGPRFFHEDGRPFSDGGG